MSGWHVLDLDGDPAPGEPSAVETLAARLREQATKAENCTVKLRAVAVDGGGLRMVGDYATAYSDALAELPDELSKLGRAYRGCGDALATYATSLAEAKTKSSTALTQGIDADGRYRTALGQLTTLLPPDREPLLWPGDEMSHGSVARATVGLDAGVVEQVNWTAQIGREADADRALARRLAGEAAALRGEAVATCTKGIDDALADSGIKNKPWWRKALDAVTKPFSSWDDFVNLCRNVALVAGVAALIISGPIGAALAAAALVAGAAILADTLAKFVRGEASLGQLALDALGVLPGGRGAASLARTISGLRAAKLVTAALRTSAAGQRLRSVTTAVPFGIRSAGGIRGALQNPDVFAKTAKCRFVGRDPVDMASGQMVMSQVDLELPGLLAWSLERTYMSSYRAGRWFGLSWSSSLDHRLEIDGEGVCYAASDGVLLTYPHPAPGGAVLPDRGQRLPLLLTDAGQYRVLDPEAGHVYEFAVPASGSRDVALPMSAVVDRNGNRLELGYDDYGALVEVRHSGGYLLDVETEQGLVTAVRIAGPAVGGEPSQEVVRYRYDSGGQLTEVVNSSGSPLRFDYDESGRLARWVDRNGTEYAYTYDDEGRVVQTAGSGGAMDGSLSYDSDGRVTRETNSLGHVTEYHYNDRMQLRSKIDPLGRVTTYEWDEFDRKLTETDPLGRTVRYVYDADGNVAEVVRPDGLRTSIQWNDLRLPASVVEPDGARWERGYDGHGNLTSVTDPAGTRTTFTYDGSGRLAGVTDVLGGVRLVETNAAGLPVAVVDPVGSVTTYERDAFGRVVAVTDPLGSVTAFAWTVEGKISSRRSPDGATERWRYDGEGNLVEQVDAAGLMTRTEYTHFDLPSARTGPDGARLEFAYDTELRLVAVTNPQGLVWRYDFDPAGSLVRETDFNGRVLGYEHDEAGQLVRRTNGAGQTVRFTRDLLGDVVEKHVVEKRVVEKHVVEKNSESGRTTFEYDAAGRVLRATNAEADCGFERDALGRVVAESCNGRTVTSTYDELGRRVSRRTPTGAQSSWEFDGVGLPLALRTAGRSLTFTHDAAGREVERALDGRVALAQSWTRDHRLRSQTVTVGARRGGEQDLRVVQRRDYTYSPDGYVTEIDDLLAGLRSYDLDPARRVTTVMGTNWHERYAYDDAGNVTDASWPVPADDQGGDGRVDSDVQGDREFRGTLLRRAGRVRYEHDAQGRLVLRQQKRLSGKPRTWRYEWDAEDRLVGVVTPDGQNWRYHYDPFGRRVAKLRLDEAGAVAERVDFTWDGVQLAEQSRTGASGSDETTTTWDWEPDSFRPIAQTDRRSQPNASKGVDKGERDKGEQNQAWFDAQFHAIVTDLVGTPSELVDPDGELAWHNRPSLWGSATQTAPDTGRVDCPLRFPGQYFDPETGSHYNYHRHYDPITAHYTSLDPLGLELAPNPTTYVHNPLTWIDPFGLGPNDSCSPNLPKVAQRIVQRGSGPPAARNIVRIDRPERSVPGSQWHAHGKNGGALNQDGTIHDRDPKFPSKTLDWLREYGWKV